MARLCKSLALGAKSPVLFFFMEHIFLDVARHWEDKPLPVEEAKLVESFLLQPLEDLVEGIEANASSEKVLNLLKRDVSAYLILFGCSLIRVGALNIQVSDAFGMGLDEGFAGWDFPPH